MPEEVKEVQPEANADQVAPVQDIDLDSAAEEAERRLEGEVPAQPTTEEAKEEVVEEVKEPDVVEEKVPDPAPEELKEDTEDHKERTKLGRKVAKLEDTIGQLLEQNKVLIERLVAPPKEPEQESEFLDLNTPEGLNTFLTRREKQLRENAQKEKVTYALGYESQVKGWIDKAKETEDPDITEIHKLITGDTPFNVRRSSNPQADFEVNLSKAEAHYYKNKAKTPVPEKKPPLENATPRSPLAVGGESKADLSVSTVKPLKISPEAMEFAKASGWGDDDIKSILASPINNPFVKGRR